MELKEIQNLIKFVAKSGANEVKLEMNDIKITIKTGQVKSETTIIQQPSRTHFPVATQDHQTTAALPLAQEEPSIPKKESTGENTNYIEIKSPIIGTFYRKPSPDKPLFVSVGDQVNIGDTVCIIEAMKLFNEVESEVSGKIVKILVEDSTPVEFDQPLFLVDPS